MAWRFVPLCELGKVTTGSTPKSTESAESEERVPFVTPSDLGSSEPIVSANRSLNSSDAAKARLIPRDSVLVCCIGATIGKVGIAGTELVTNQQINSVTFSERLIIPRFGMHALRFYKSMIISSASVTTMPIVNKTRFERLEIPVPPLEVQHDIADALDRAEGLRLKRRESVALIDELARSVFREMFGDMASNARGWDDSRALGEVASVTSGITKGRKAPSAPLRPVPYMAVVNVQDMHLDLSVIKEIEVTESEIERYRLRRDDLLLTEGGDPDKLGRGTLWSEELPECIHQNHIFRVRLNDGSRVHPVYLNWLVSSEWGRQYFLRSAKQTTGIASINATQLKNFPLLVPPLGAQEEFAARLSQISDLKKLQSSHFSQLGTLFRSIQDRAFRGELWAKNPEA